MLLEFLIMMKDLMIYFKINYFMNSLINLYHFIKIYNYDEFLRENKLKKFKT